VTDASPFLRNIRDTQEANGVHRDRTVVKGPSSASVQKEVSRCWTRSGVRKNEHTSGHREEFKANHGFRKFFETQLSRAEVSWEDQEVFLGHRLNYSKPTLASG
jgi:hypothetical protein